MNWYYVEYGERAGPVSDAEWEELVKTGKIAPNTLVWREGMEDWQRYKEIGGGGEPGAAQPTLLEEARETRGPSAAVGPDAVEASAWARGTTSGTSAGATAGERYCAECGRAFPTSEMVAYAESWVCAACKPVFFRRVKEGLRAGEGLEYGGFWIRFAAKVLDAVIVYALGELLALPVVALVRMAVAAGAGDIEILAAFPILLWIFGFLAFYSVFFVGKFGATPGKMACGLRVVTSEGGRISYPRAFGRFLAEILSYIPFCIGCIAAASDDEKRTLHDRLCGTRVVAMRVAAR